MCYTIKHCRRTA